MGENKEILRTLQKDKRIKREIDRLNRILKDIESNKKKAINPLIGNVAFMSVSLEELQEIINNKGYTESYKNGANQFGLKDCPEIKIYNSMFKNYNTAVKHLIDLLPEGKEEEEDELLKFIRR